MTYAPRIQEDVQDHRLDAETLEIFQLGLRMPSIDDRAEAGVGSCELPLWGDSEPMRRMFDMVERVAPTRANVLLIGESGTGKEVVAQSLHRKSGLDRKPFIAINCGAIPATLIEAELFGHERGSFTGAVRNHKGVFERAAGGTLFLDEITEMPLDMQVKLLRVLETGRFYRVGGDNEIDVQCRIVAATNRDPEQAVASGTLRADLLYRLAVFPMVLPALRERGADVELLADRMLAELNLEHGTSKRLSADAQAFLREHSWPGNVRELKNALHRAFILADDELDLSTVVAPVARGTTPDDCITVRIGVSIAEAERDIILATLERCGGNKRHTAKVLGVSLKTLYNRLNDYDRFALNGSTAVRPALAPVAVAA